MNGQELRQWMRQIERRLAQLEGAERKSSTAPKEIDTVPAPPVKTGWLTVGMAYRERYLKARKGQVLDYYVKRHFQAFEDLSCIVDAYPEPLEALSKALDGFFRDKWAREHDFPPTALVKGFERFYAPPVVKREEEPDPEAINRLRLKEHREREEAEMMRKLEGYEREAVKPPPIEELVSKIGRKV